MLKVLRKYHFGFIFSLLFSALIIYSAYHFEAHLHAQEKLIFVIAIYSYVALFLFSIFNKIRDLSKDKLSFLKWDLF